MALFSCRYGDDAHKILLEPPSPDVATDADAAVPAKSSGSEEQNPLP
jgi:hypothetical protein